MASAKTVETLQSLPFGFEIELAYITQQTAIDAVQSVVGGTTWQSGYGSWRCTAPDGRVWKAVSDSSISPWGCEVVSPILRYEDISSLQEIVRALRRAGGKANTSTGIHVHVDGSRFGAKATARLAKYVHKQEALLVRALDIHETRRSDFCSDLSTDMIERMLKGSLASLDDVAASWYGDCPTWSRDSRYHHSRYHGLNLHSLFNRGTVEFRWFNSSTHAGVVKTYIQLALALCAKALLSRSARWAKRSHDPTTEKYDVRVVLLRLGLIGDEFKTARYHLTKHLNGSASRNGKGAARAALAAA